jgi:hypothetical protein
MNEGLLARFRRLTSEQLLFFSAGCDDLRLDGTTQMGPVTLSGSTVVQPCPSTEVASRLIGTVLN